MRYTDRGRIRRFAPAFAPLLLAALALPLMAPTCGSSSTGPKVFSKGSLIIPMDECYQNTPTTLTNATYSPPYAGCPSNGGTTYDAGNVLRAYGLVYQLLRNNIPVYWVINPNKTALLDTANPDITLSLNGGAPVGKYQWANPGSPPVPGAAPPNNNTFTINYHGGPFVVDGSDAAAASTVMQSLKVTFGGTPPSTTNGPNLVNVHVTSVAFSANVAKSMSGGFQNSGGAVAPPIALLNITGGDGKNSESVTRGYLVDAGLGPADFAGAGGTSSPTGHGKIYDDLYAPDFMTSACTTTCANGSPCTGGLCASNLVAYNYSILWVPHWYGPGSETSACNAAGCTTATCPSPGSCGPPFPAGTTYADVLSAIRGYMNAGHDVMAECAGLGTFEGVNNTAGFGSGSPAPATQVQTTTGVNINETGLAGGRFWGNFASPFIQLGDFPYSPITGAIRQYSPTAAYVTRPAGYQLLRLISDSTSTTKDYFTLLPAYNGMGTVVYLAGHDFAGSQGYATQLAGARLVLNTLFNLGNACFASGAPCNTGKLGVCAAGTMQCVGGVPTCVQTTQPSAEVCDGLDNDCNGAVDDIAPQQTYAYTPGAGQPPGPGCACTGTGCTVQSDNTCRGTGPCSWQCLGLCHPGISSCVFPAGTTPGTVVPLTAVSAQQAPVAEICNGLDDDCDGVVDNGVATRPCYDGPAGTMNVGTCRPGTQSCVNGSYGLCTGQTLPGPEFCEPPQDTNCNGIVGDGCGCVPGATRVCYTGPAGTANVGQCLSGTMTCGASGRWSDTCTGEVLPAPRGCTTADADCDGIPDNQQVCGCVGGVPQPTGTRSCYDGAAGTVNVGVCLAGTQACSNGVWATACLGEIVPAAIELCNGKNDTCSATWTTDDGVGACPLGLTCSNGSCVPSTCGMESYCPSGSYTCNTTTSKCVPVNCPTAPCPQGQVCTAGACVDPCAGVACGPGSFCTGGACVGGGCLATGCSVAGQICLAGTCQVNPCATVTCPTGTFCRPPTGEAWCVESCAFVSCASGQRCGPDGFCVADPCNGVVCGPGQVCCGAGQACTAGICVADPCASVNCGSGQVCQGGACIANPCTGVTCPSGQCVGGQCFSSFNPTGAGGVPFPSLPPQPTTTKSGCGCGGGAAEGLPALLLGLLAIPMSRRRRGPGRRGGGGALTALLLALGATAMGCGGKSETGPCTATSCGSTCTDLKIDPANCGACGQACSAGQICVDSKCGPGSAVAPYLTGLNPSAAPTGGTAPVTVTVTGQRFQSGATVVALGISAPVTTTFVDSGHLTAQVNLGAVSPAAAEIRVVNPDRTISNGLPFSVTAAAPSISSLNPSQAVTRAGQPPGTTLSIAVTGTGFIPSSQCHISNAPSFPEQGLATTYGSASALSCALDLSTTQPGSYSLTVANGAVKSNALPFTVTSGTPTLTGINPTGGTAGTVTWINASGSGFDATSQLLFDGAPFGTTTFLGPGSLYAQPLDLTGKTVGAHFVTVRNGAGGTPTAAQTFNVSAAAPILNGVTTSPAPARQGQAATLTLTGTGFDSTSRIVILPPGGTNVTLVPASQTSTQLTASYTFLLAGSYSVSVQNGTQSSGALTVTAVSNVAILAGIAPANAQQGQTVTLTLTAANLGASPTVHLDSTSLGCPPPAPCALVLTPTVSGNTLTATIPSLGGWDTGTFAVTVVNSGAAASNGLGFTVTPGQPTLASALTVAAPQKACAVQGPTPVPIALTGTNFAKPDASGNGGSSVHASSAALGVTDFLIPAAATTVDSATQITVAFDTTLAVPGTYNISVWNPGPTILKSVENVTFQILASGTCP